MARTVGSSAPETRRRILDSAADAFAAHGYSGASMRDIAEGLGITKAALYYHFASKEDLLDGLVHPVMQSMADFAETAQSGGLTPAQILRGFVDLTVDSVPALFPLMGDPGARSAIKARYDLQELNRRIEAALAGDGGPESLLRAQFVLGGIRSMVLGRLFRGAHGECPRTDAGRGGAAGSADAAGPAEADGHAGAQGWGGGHGWRFMGGGAVDDAPLLNDAERAIVLEAALAGLAEAPQGAGRRY